MNDLICIYHNNCADGFGAAWAVRQALGDIEFHGATHGDPPPDVTGKRVIMVDFAYKRPVIEQMAKQAQSILILDHHKAAAEDLSDILSPWEAFGLTQNEYDEDGWIPDDGVCALFDMDRSGAGIAWDYFHDAIRPKLIDHIEDRDLWRFSLPGTREIQSAVFSYPHDFDTWDWLINEASVDELRVEGAAIMRKHQKDVDEFLQSNIRRMVIGGHSVPVANLPYFYASEAGHWMALDKPFAACYWDTPEGRVFSLRSREDGVDVSEIAVSYGGGGHEHAAGFRMPIGWEGE